MATHISTEELDEAITVAAVRVIDSLPAAAYGRRHLPGAINVTEEDPDTVVAQRVPRRGEPLVIYSTDEHCNRGPDMVTRLTALGYTNVRLYAAGIEGWVAAGLPVES